MTVLRVATQLSGVCAFATVIPLAVGAQGSADIEARARARFSRFDGNQSGWLSGRELVACGCRTYDRDGNSEVTWAEFYRGELQAAVAQMQRDAGAAAPADDRPAQVQRPAGGAGAAYRVGERVTWTIGEIGYPGTIYNVDGDRYQVDRDGFGRAREWVAAAELTRLGPAQAPARTPPAARPPAAPPARGGTPPVTVPTGVYVCTTYSNYATTLGRLRIIGDGVYTGLTPDGSGSRQRFAYDPGSGTITWAGGRIPGLAWPVQQSQYSVDARGNGFIVVHSQLRAGGNVNSMSCVRE